MKYTTNKNGAVLEVTVSGRLDTLTAPELDKALAPLLSDVESLVFDFTNLDYISSAGLRVLLAAHRGIAMGGKTTLKNCNPVVREVLEVTGFNDVFEIE